MQRHRANAEFCQSGRGGCRHCPVVPGPLWRVESVGFIVYGGGGGGGGVTQTGAHSTRPQTLVDGRRHRRRGRGRGAGGGRRGDVGRWHVPARGVTEILSRPNFSDKIFRSKI